MIICTLAFLTNFPTYLQKASANFGCFDTFHQEDAGLLFILLKVNKNLALYFSVHGKYSMNANPSLVTDCVHRWKMKQDSTEGGN